MNSGFIQEALARKAGESKPLNPLQEFTNLDEWRQRARMRGCDVRAGLRGIHRAVRDGKVVGIFKTSSGRGQLEQVS